MSTNNLNVKVPFRGVEQRLLTSRLAFVRQGALTALTAVVLTLSLNGCGGGSSGSDSDGKSGEGSGGGPRKP